MTRGCGRSSNFAVIKKPHLCVSVLENLLSHHSKKKKHSLIPAQSFMQAYSIEQRSGIQHWTHSRIEVSCAQDLSSRVENYVNNIVPIKINSCQRRENLLCQYHRPASPVIIYHHTLQHKSMAQESLF
ncbi:hypothetical protein VNO77_42016 [Canavalia gladiata]|uniref:Uncharacterized protein n=1 Tax=Canavalia gladiata TaxID=3824 RepID=A0AAN9K1Q2_CANGL